MQKTVLIALALVGTLTAGYFLYARNHPTKPTSDLKNIFNQWKVEYQINVGAAEDDFRFKVFSATYAKIEQHNKLRGRSFDMGLNAFSHLTQEEFATTKLGYKVPKVAVKTNVTELPTNLATKADWTGKMNPVKNQASCGSCWAFSAIGAVEGVHSVKKSKLMDLSEQELVDCSGSYGNMGCNGGLMDYAFQYIIDKKGSAATKDYAYKGVDGSCKSVATRNNAITGFTDVKVNSAAALKAAIAQQPVSVAIEADTATFQSYKSGVITGSACGTQLDHGVVAVGYNDEDRTPYYVVRNSWGTSWGDKGHVKIGIEEGAGVCGIQMAASYPTI